MCCQNYERFKRGKDSPGFVRAWPPIHSADARKSSHGQPRPSCHSRGHLVTEIVLGGELEEFCLSLEEVRFYAACIALALQHLHSLCVGHFDLNGSNCLVDERGYLKVIDFGMAAILDGPSLVPKRSDAHYQIGRCLEQPGIGSPQTCGASGFFLFYAFFGAFALCR